MRKIANGGFPGVSNGIYSCIKQNFPKMGRVCVGLSFSALPLMLGWKISISIGGSSYSYPFPLGSKCLVVASPLRYFGFVDLKIMLGLLIVLIREYCGSLGQNH